MSSYKNGTLADEKTKELENLSLRIMSWLGILILVLGLAEHIRVRLYFSSKGNVLNQCYVYDAVHAVHAVHDLFMDGLFVRYM
jgi:hypothetical protein